MAGEEETQAAKRPRRIAAVKCEECGESEAKYRCPGCALRTCGLPCVRSHKERTGCGGKRSRTGFVPLGEYNDNVLISDYNLLEETLRQADAARRLRAPLGDGKDRLSNPMRVLQRQARIRSTSLLYLAQGMSKRKSNTSHYEKKSNRICWRVEWAFEGTEVELVDRRVHENLSLESILQNRLTRDSKDVMLRHRLRNFCEMPISELQLLLLSEPCSAAEKVYHQLHLKGTLRDELANKSIIEYPVIRVLLPRDAGKYMVAASVTDEGAAEDPILEMTPHEPEGVPLREEEIGDAEKYMVTASVTDEGAAEDPILEMTPHEPEGVPLREEEIEEGEFVLD